MRTVIFLKVCRITEEIKKQHPTFLVLAVLWSTLIISNMQYSE